MSVTNRRRDSDREEERIYETPIDELTLIAMRVDEIVILRHQQLMYHRSNVLLVDARIVQLFDMFCF